MTTNTIQEGDKLYVITRRDLDPGYQGVQSIHAMRQFSEEHPEIDNEWFKVSNYLAWLSVTDESEIFALLSKAEEKQIKFSVFREPDVENQITAIVLEPGQKTAELCRRLPLALKS